MRKNLYVDIWTRLVPYIMQALQQSMLEESAMAMPLNPDAFNAAGIARAIHSASHLLTAIPV